MLALLITIIIIYTHYYAYFCEIHHFLDQEDTIFIYLIIVSEFKFQNRTV